jgi:hypothetical protein
MHMNLQTILSLHFAGDDSDGDWVTINGQHILIKKGESVKDAFLRRVKEDKLKVGSKEYKTTANNHVELEKQLRDKAFDKLFKDKSKENKDGSFNAKGRAASQKLQKQYGEMEKYQSHPREKEHPEDFRDENSRGVKFSSAHDAIEDWARNSSPRLMNAFVKALQNGDLSNPGAKELASMATKAQSALGKGGRAVTLYRVETSGGGKAVTSKAGVATSYSVSKAGVQNYLSNMKSDESIVQPRNASYTIHADKVPVNQIVSYYKQSSGFAQGQEGDHDPEYEVIVSTKPLKLK